MKQRTALLLATALTLFATIGITAVVLASAGRQTEAANSEVVPAVSSSTSDLALSDTSLSADREAAYRAQIEQANLQLQAAYEQIQQLQDQNQQLRQREELYRQRLEESNQAIQLLQSQVDQLSGSLAFNSSSDPAPFAYEGDDEGEYEHDKDSAYEDDEDRAYEHDKDNAHKDDENHLSDSDQGRVYEDGEDREYDHD
ncbi:MAG: hypothetical protein GXP38_10930 [Chloroflexi bacterium]|nr:hypothetical protein [Chloroflexota bacterium]